MSLLQWLQIFSWQMKTGGCNLYQLTILQIIRYSSFSHLRLYAVCNKYIMYVNHDYELYVNHDYEAYENEVLRLLFTLESVFIPFHVIQKKLYIEKTVHHY